MKKDKKANKIGTPLVLTIISIVVVFLYTFEAFYWLRIIFAEGFDNHNSFLSWIIDFILILPYLFMFLHLIRSDKNSSKYIILTIISAVVISIGGFLFFVTTF